MSSFIVLAREEHGHDAQQHADRDRGHAVVDRIVELLCRIRPGERDRDADERRAVLQEDDERRRILGLHRGLEVSALALARAELAEGEGPRDPFEHRGQCEHDVVHARVYHLDRVHHVADALVGRDAGADREDQQRHDEGPEVILAPVAERVRIVGGPRRLARAVHEQHLVARVHERVHGLAQHGGAVRDRRGTELGDRDEQVRGERREEDGAGAGGHGREGDSGTGTAQPWKFSLALARTI